MSSHKEKRFEYEQHFDFFAAISSGVGKTTYCFIDISASGIVVCIFICPLRQLLGGLDFRADGILFIVDRRELDDDINGTYGLCLLVQCRIFDSVIYSDGVPVCRLNDVTFCDAHSSKVGGRGRLSRIAEEKGRFTFRKYLEYFIGDRDFCDPFFSDLAALVFAGLADCRATDFGLVAE